MESAPVNRKRLVGHRGEAEGLARFRLRGKPAVRRARRHCGHYGKARPTEPQASRTAGGVRYVAAIDEGIDGRQPAADRRVPSAARREIRRLAAAALRQGLRPQNG